MKKSKRLAASLAFSALTLLGAQAAFAADITNLQAGDIIELNLGNRASGPGGEFIASLYDSVNPPPAAPGSFVTFCLEKSENFYVGAPLKVAGVSLFATAGGGGAVAGKDYISDRTAWLYTEFRSGNLSNYGDSDIANDADALQNVFWFFENEITSLGDSLSGSELAQAQSWVDLADAAVGLGWTNLANGNVRVLNLLRKDGSGNYTINAQDQLYITPVPEPEIYAMMIAGLGLMGFVARRRKQYGAVA